MKRNKHQSPKQKKEIEKNWAELTAEFGLYFVAEELCEAVSTEHYLTSKEIEFEFENN